MIFKNYSYGLFSIILLLITLNGCFDDDAGIQKRVSMNYTVDNIDQTLIGNSNEISITQVKFLVGELDLFTTSEDTLSISVNGLRFRFDLSQAGGEELIIEGPTGFSNFDEFDKLDILVRTAQLEDNISDGDLIAGPDEDQQFGLVIKGILNDESFTFSQKLEERKSFEFIPPVKLTNDLETLSMTLRTDIEEVFFTDTSPARLLDPTNEEDIPLIVENFIQSFTIEAEPISQVNF